MQAVQFVLLLALLPLLAALDCRKFSFAPACRGIMLKRSQPTEEAQITAEAKALMWLLAEAEAEGTHDCIPVEWIRAKIGSVLPLNKRGFSSFA